MIIVCSYRDKVPTGFVRVNTTSRAKTNWEKSLSPFYLSDCKLYGKFIARRMENGWQYSKVYPEHADVHGNPLGEYWDWAENGLASYVANRYPMGKGRKPLYSLWDGERLDYIEARKRIYVPLYIKSVARTMGWKQLVEIQQLGHNIALVDFDGYRNDLMGMSLTNVLNCEPKKMGHAFVLKMMLDSDSALNQCKL